MAYSTNANVRAICDTDITNAEIDDLIDECDDLLDLMVDMGSVSVNIRRALSSTFTAIRCMLKDPSAQALGEYREDPSDSRPWLNENTPRQYLQEPQNMVDCPSSISCHRGPFCRHTIWRPDNT